MIDFTKEIEAYEKESLKIRLEYIDVLSDIRKLAEDHDGRDFENVPELIESKSYDLKQISERFIAVRELIEQLKKAME